MFPALGTFDATVLAVHHLSIGSDTWPGYAGVRVLPGAITATDGCTVASPHWMWCPGRLSSLVMDAALPMARYPPRPPIRR